MTTFLELQILYLAELIALVVKLVQLSLLSTTGFLQLAIMALCLVILDACLVRVQEDRYLSVNVLREPNTGIVSLSMQKQMPYSIQIVHVTKAELSTSLALRATGVRN